MKLNVESKLKEADLTVLGLFEEDKHNYKDFNQKLSEEISDAISKKIFTKKYGHAYSSNLNNSTKRVLILGLGKKEEFTLEKFRKSINKSFKYSRSRKCKSISTNLLKISNFNTNLLGRATAEGFFLSEYIFDKYITPDKENPKVKLENIYLEYSSSKELLNGLEEGEIIANATNFARDLVNEPAIEVTPAYFEKLAKEISKKNNISLTVLNKKDMVKLKMGGLLGVTAGSDQEPKLLILEYKGSSERPIALVGKGVTFDAGGYNLKPSGHMETMKCDMGGAAAVFGAIKAASEMKVKKHIIALMPLCENLVNGSAYKPGDILRAYNKKTIEIGNTDAEGRLILADAISYAEEKYKPKILIDLATLTGACVVALGEQISGLMSKDDNLSKELEDAGLSSHDRVWRLPMLEEYQDAMKGSISDIKNIAPRSHGAGAITAAVFLSHFVNTEKTKWAHIDIAGPGFIAEDRDYLTKGGTGAGVRLLSYFLSK
ncbi:leucyl aminopeptidase [archaeon]|nr:leucyl aminopeptidase [archaeon]MBT3731059.1 leucyl aminopeptidase [archaeon]MBT4670172.1 leucyl aminopeptidase [archaeon]MBT5030538.1 leucyl aminopeptidase [archaeon]MBT5287891.1 leucyl aminopeptidase [archaeon]